VKGTPFSRTTCDLSPCQGRMISELHSNIQSRVENTGTIRGPISSSFISDMQ